jgi:hypothetical protein
MAAAGPARVELLATTPDHFAAHLSHALPLSFT